MDIARFTWAGVLFLSAAACRNIAPPTNAPLVTVSSAVTPNAPADPPPAGPQEVQIGVQGDAYADTDPSALTDFRSTLDPYGYWLNDPTYGMVWTPARDVVGDDFVPYLTAGHWVYDDDYIWVSDYDWGWAPFHYGRWVMIPGRGWVWIPGRAYSGAWVNWRLSPDSTYLGWAPMPPTWAWRNGVAVGLALVPPEPWAFVPRTQIFAPRVAFAAIVGPRAVPFERRSRLYVRPGPAYAGHPLARPYMHGPPPAVLNVGPSRVVHPGPADRGVRRAWSFSRPSTARAMGGRPATPHMVRPARPPSRGGVPSRGGPPRRR